MRNFRQLKIWEKGFEIAIQSYKFCKFFPLKEKYDLGQQIKRAAVSIPANIAEGASRASEKDFGRFIEIALGSCFELETHLQVCKVLEFGDHQMLITLLKMVEEERKMLIAFSKRIRDRR